MLSASDEIIGFIEHYITKRYKNKAGAQVFFKFAHKFEISKRYHTQNIRNSSTNRL